MSSKDHEEPKNVKISEYERFKRAVQLDCMTQEFEEKLAKKHPKPNDQEWTTDIFNCFEDPESCKTGLFCPCVLHGKNTEMLRGIPWKGGCLVHSTLIGSCIGSCIIAASTLALCPTCTGSLLCGWMCSISSYFIFASHATGNRDVMHKRYHLKENICGGRCNDDCVHGFLHLCALCQENRELKKRICVNANNRNAPMNPPPLQAMDVNHMEK